ncbi:MAG: DUF2330 domain-containing protein, partial [Verrucomicrobiaceae bacterium]
SGMVGLFIILILPSQGRLMGGSSAPVPGVEVVRIQNAGTFQATTLRSRDASSLTEWLDLNGYAQAPQAKAAIEEYVLEGWFFVAMKVRREGNNKTGALHPVTFRFASEKPVYPMRLTATATRNQPLTLDLFVLGPASAAVPHMEVRRSSLLGGDGRSGEMEVRSRRVPDVRRWYGTARVGTWLRGDIPADQLIRDIYPMWSGIQIHEPVVTSWPNAAGAWLSRSLPFVVVGMLFLRAGRRLKGLPARFWKAMAFACGMLGVAWGTVHFSTLHKTRIRESTEASSKQSGRLRESGFFRCVEATAETLRRQQHRQEGKSGTAFTAAVLAELLRTEYDDLPFSVEVEDAA